MGPVPALLVQIVMNQTGLLDKLLNQHLISAEQKVALANGLTVRATNVVDGKSVEQFVYVDKDTGAINRVNLNDVRLPNHLNGVELSPDQMNKLKEGKTIEFVADGTYMAARIDMTEANCVKSYWKEMKSDLDYKEVPTILSSNKEKLEYIAHKGVRGIADIYGGGAKNSERDDFLRNFGIEDQYKAAKESQCANLAASNPAAMVAKKALEAFKKGVNGALDIVLGEDEEQSKSYRR